MKKTVRVGKINVGVSAWKSFFCDIKIKSGNLSISGAIGPRKDGGCVSCGQINMEFARRDPKDNDDRYSNPIQPKDIRFAFGWDAEKWLDFLDIWATWHLNDLQPGCEHQRKDGWGKKKITINGKTKMSAFVYPSEHPEGVLCKPCPVCEYGFGTSWIKMHIPQSIVDFLVNLPEADQKSPWN